MGLGEKRALLPGNVLAEGGDGDVVEATLSQILRIGFRCILIPVNQSGLRDLFGILTRQELGHFLVVAMSTVGVDPADVRPHGVGVSMD